MSLSNESKDTGHVTGRVYMGLGSGPSEMSIGDIDGQTAHTMWTAKTEAEYIERVRNRATLMAKDIIAKAMAEAKDLKAQALAEGRAQAMAESEDQLKLAVKNCSDALAGAVTALENGTKDIWKQHRRDVAALVRMTVERTLKVELDDRKEEVLASLLDQALDAVDSQKNLLITVNPADEQAVNELLTEAKASHPGLDRWGVRTRDDLQPGGMILESDNGMVDNTIEGRYATVGPILDQLGVEPEGDEA